jgi:serine/threonine-protein kinase RsbW
VTSPQDRFKLSFGASDLATRDAVAQVTLWLLRCGLAAEQIGNVEIALAEAINNIVEHAYDGAASGKICLTVKQDSARLSICICDQGKPMPGHALPNGSPQNLSGPICELPEGGFGWHLIRQLTSRASYAHRDRRNILALEIDL